MSLGKLPRLGVAVWLAVGWIGVVVFVAIFADVLPLRDPDSLGLRTGEVARHEGPGFNAWFGADGQGRDLLSQVIHGARPALILGVTVIAVSASLGTMIGVTAGFVRGRFDTVTAVVIDASLAFPALVLLIAVRSAFGNSIWVFLTIFSILSVPSYARIVRGSALELAEREFVDAARSMGATPYRIIVRELLPNVAIPVVSFAFIGFALVILAEGGLAFIGLSLDQTTWGKLIAEGSREIRDHPHVALIPSTVMLLTILSFNMLGEAIQSSITPRAVATQRRLRAGGVHEPGPDTAVLHIHDLKTELATPVGAVVAVDRVHLSVARGEALGIVGESGSGKTMILRSIVGAFPLADVTRSGTIELDRTDMLRTDSETLRRVLGTRIGMVSQNPLTALNPVRRIETQIAEPMRVHRGFDRTRARRHALELMQQVGIPDPEQRLREYPHQLSGGMRQRVTIAIALANNPELLLADEPTTALDVTVQDQILRLFDDLRASQQMALVLVTHDLAVVKGHTDNVAIIYAGQVVEHGPTAEVLASPRHPYSRALIRSMPDLGLPPHSRLDTIEGSPPSLSRLPAGCRFAPRCGSVQQKCHDEAPTPTGSDQHSYSCWFPNAAVAVEVGHGR